jgi:hypothetical protein
LEIRELQKINLKEQYWTYQSLRGGNMSELGSPGKTNSMPLKTHYVPDIFRATETENSGCVEDAPLMRKTRNRTKKLVVILGR